MSACRSCGAAVTWATTRSGKSMPLDEAPSDKGTWVHVAGKTWQATDEDRRLMRPMHTSHFATCPQADAWRQGR